MYKYHGTPAKLWRHVVFLLTILLLSTTFIACEVKTTLDGVKVEEGESTAVGTGAQGGLKLLVLPEAGEKSVTDPINNAKKSIWLEIYLLSNENVIRALEDAANRGVEVRVMIDTRPFGGGSVSPKETIDRLKGAGAQAQSTYTKYRFTHAKMMIVDGQDGYIMTSNLTKAALGASSQKNREYIIVTSNKSEVEALKTIFTADWDRKDPKYDAPNLVVSPINARASFLSLVKEAKTSIDVQAETLQDDAVENALAEAAKRGVKVQIIIPNSQDGESMDTNNKAGAQIVKKGGGKVKEARKLYMHAKLFIIDGKKAFVGSENISTNSLDNNREIGIIMSDQPIIQKLQDSFNIDWRNGVTI